MVLIMVLIMLRLIAQAMERGTWLWWWAGSQDCMLRKP
jgi:hypothetical protein